MAKWLAGWITKSANRVRFPADYLIGHCCQQCQPRLNTGEAEAPAVDPDGNKQFHLNQVGAFVGYPR